MPKLVEAVPPLVECIAKFVGLGIPLFVRDLLRLIAKLLRCIAQQLQSILNVMGGLALQIASAAEPGQRRAARDAAVRAGERADVRRSIRCRRSSRSCVLLSLAEPFLGIAGVDPIKTPQIGSDTDLAGAADQVVTARRARARRLYLIADSTGSAVMPTPRDFLGAGLALSRCR